MIYIYTYKIAITLIGITQMDSFIIMHNYICFVIFLCPKVISEWVIIPVIPTCSICVLVCAIYIYINTGLGIHVGCMHHE